MPLPVTRPASLSTPAPRKVFYIALKGHPFVRLAGCILQNTRRLTFKSACAEFFSHPEHLENFNPDNMTYKGFSVFERV